MAPQTELMMPRSRIDPHPLFVGREEEMENLLGAISSVLSGKGRCVILSGEAGIGKSRLIEELGMRTAVAGFTVLQGQCHSGNRGSPNGPVDQPSGGLCLWST